MKRIVLNLTEREADALASCLVALGEPEEHFRDAQLLRAIERAKRKLIAALAKA